MTEAPLRLLLVEDEAIPAMNLSQELKGLGYDVLPPVATGEQALEKAAAENPDFVLLDINLPGMIDGVETARQLLAKHQLAIIFMTGYADDQVALRTGSIEKLACLSKPVVPEQIDRIIRAACG